MRNWQLDRKSTRLNSSHLVKSSCSRLQLTHSLTRRSSALEQAEKLLYPAKGLAGGGQLEVRMKVSEDHPDPDIRGVARRVKFFNLESWHKEWTEVAQKNEELAARSEEHTSELQSPCKVLLLPSTADPFADTTVFRSGTSGKTALSGKRASRGRAAGGPHESLGGPSGSRYTRCGAAS